MCSRKSSDIGLCQRSGVPSRGVKGKKKKGGGETRESAAYRIALCVLDRSHYSTSYAHFGGKQQHIFFFHQKKKKKWSVKLYISFVYPPPPPPVSRTHSTGCPRLLGWQFDQTLRDIGFAMCRYVCKVVVLLVTLTLDTMTHVLKAALQVAQLDQERHITSWAEVSFSTVLPALPPTGVEVYLLKKLSQHWQGNVLLAFQWIYLNHVPAVALSTTDPWSEWSHRQAVKLLKL